MKFKAFLAATILIGFAAFQVEVKADNVNKEFDKSAISPIFTYYADMAGNMRGGLSASGGYLGYGYTGIAVNTDRAGWWRGGKLTLTLGSTHGVKPSEMWLGDFQVADYIEGGTHIFLQDFNLQQQLGSLQLTIGMQDLCANYAVCEPAGLFFNSTFGIHSVASMNMDVPIFPIFGLGVNLRYDISEQLYVEGALYDTPIGFDQNPYNLNIDLSPQDGYIAAAEVGFMPHWSGLGNGGYTVGALYETSQKIANLYVNCWQEVWHGNNGLVITPFVMGSIALSEDLQHDIDLAGGINLKGLFSSKGILGIAVTTSHFLLTPDTELTREYETALELTYQYSIGNHLSIQPDVQYILHPSGTGRTLPNALFVAIRAKVDISD
ncbi:MAG: carbohydrate porin [Bacteroidales bacterium]|nr:carbohydrate porin [Candidatus Colimorpha onthohippi]